MMTKRLVSDYDNILRSKMYFFLKKSIWKYLLCSIVLGFLAQIGTMSSVLSSVIYFGGIMLILLPLQIWSAKRMSKQLKFDANVSFKENEIIIEHNNKTVVEAKDWTWIKTIESKKDRYWLVVNQKTPFGISIPKSDMNSSEIELFERKINGKR